MERIKRNILEFETEEPAPIVERAWTEQTNEDEARLLVQYTDQPDPVTVCTMIHAEHLPNPAELIGLTEREAESMVTDLLLEPIDDTEGLEFEYAY